MHNIPDELKKISFILAEKCGSLSFAGEIAAVYNPLEYARRSHEMYLDLAGDSPKKVIFLGMNPGPWGMAQTGVPFGEISAVRDWLGIETEVGRPENEHPKRPIMGFSCARSEVSGRRLWGLFQKRFGMAEEFFREHFAVNYCPLVFMNQSGANVTPDKLPKEETKLLFEFCDNAFADTIKLLKPEWVIGIGAFAKKRIDKIQKDFFRNAPEIPGKDLLQFSSAQILHPSPASPKANSGWEVEAEKTLAELGIWK